MTGLSLRWHLQSLVGISPKQLQRRALLLQIRRISATWML